MILVVRQKQHDILCLGPSPLFKGGEGKLFGCPGDDTTIAKIFDEPHEGERLKRVSALTERPFSAVPQNIGGLVAPEDLLLDPATGEFRGYSMPRVHDAKPILSIWSPLSDEFRGFEERLLIAFRIAQLFVAFEAHPLNVVYADLNSQNVLIDKDNRAWLIDIDSSQLTSKDGDLLLSRMHTVDFLSPRLQGKKLELTPRTRADERFALAVLFFKLLMEGSHPNSAVSPDPSRDLPKLTERIRRGIWPYAQPPGYFLPPVDAPDFDDLPDTVRELFHRCFQEGTDDPSVRPSAQEWADAFGHELVNRSPSPTVPTVRRFFPSAPAAPAVPVYADDPEYWSIVAGSAATFLLVMLAILVRGESSAATKRAASTEFEQAGDWGMPAPGLIRDFRRQNSFASDFGEGVPENMGEPPPRMIQDFRHIGHGESKRDSRKSQLTQAAPPLIRRLRPGTGNRGENVVVRRNPLESQQVLRPRANDAQQPMPSHVVEAEKPETIANHLRRIFQIIAGDLEERYRNFMK